MQEINTSSNGTAFHFRIDNHSGVPLYRQIIDQVLIAIAAGALPPGAQLPTVRQVAVDLSVNPNTVMRAYRELEIRGILDTQQGTGTFITQQQVPRDEIERRRRLDQLAGEFIARAAGEGFALDEIVECLKDLAAEKKKRSRS